MAVTLACPLCRAPAPDGTCPRCGEYPRVGGVWVALPRPGAALAALRELVLTGWVESQVASGAKSTNVSLHEDAEQTRAAAAMGKNHELLSALVTAALASRPVVRAAKPSDLASLTSSDNVWPFADTLPYFYADWSAPSGDARDRILADVARHRATAAPDQAALVLGSAGGLLVDDLATLLGVAYGIDRSIAPLLLSRRLLDGESFTAHLEDASWQPCTLRGAARTNAAAHLVAGDAAALPFADESFEVVVSQYLLDIVRDPAGVLAEIHRVLVPGGLWVNLGLPFRFRGAPSWAPRGTDAAWRAFAPRFGFDVVEGSRHPVAHRAHGELDPWSTGEVQQAVRAVLRKVAGVPPDPTREVLRAYFAGDPGPLSASTPRLRDPIELRLRLGPGGNVEHRAIHLGRATLPMPSEKDLDRTLAFFGRLDGSTSFAEIVPASGSDERDVALALEGLARAGYVTLA